MNKTSQVGLFILLFIFVTFLTACVNGVSTGSDAAAKYKLKESYTIVSDSSFIPFEFVKDGKLIGFDIDLIKVLAEEVGFEIIDGEIKTANFDTIISGLKSKEFDIAIAGISITDERAKGVDFTDAYYESGIAIGVPVDNEEIKKLKDLDGKTVATRLGTTSVTHVREHVPGARVNMYEQVDQVYQAVENGSAHAIVHDLPNLEYYISTSEIEKIKIVGELIQTEDYGIGVAQGNDDLVQALNEGLAILKENGTYDKIYEKWFGNSK